MKRYINYLLLSVFVTLLSACSEDDFNSGQQPCPGEETVVSVSADFATWSPMSRAVALNEKETFADGDVIHVQGEFKITEQTKVWRYDTYRYSGGRWIPNSADGDSSLKWPWNATEGSFTAYYLPALKETLPDGKSYECEMGGNYLRHDPLVAYAPNVPRDYAVNFKFGHLCTRLVIENTKNNYAEEYWFHKEGINNVFRLGFVETTDGETGETYNKLAFSFVSDKTINEGTISAVKVMDDSGAASNAGYVVYYLQPGKYYGSDLNYSNNRLYLKLNVDALDKPEEESSDGLKAGKTYILDIEKAKGVVNTEETEDPWENDDDVVSDFNVQELIDAIENGNEFKDILKSDIAGNLVLTKNLDFRNEDFIPKNVPTNVKLDGGHRYIMRTKHQLVDKNYGTIRNLEIRNADITDYSANHNGVVGALVANNQGYIDNIRLRDNKINVPALVGSNSTTSVGGLVGSHDGGQITDIYVIGSHTINIYEQEGEVTRGHVYLGGIAGQVNSGMLAIKNVSMLQDKDGKAPMVSLALACKEGMYAVGGVVGRLTTGIDNCTLEVAIDCSGSVAADCYVGGLFGNEDAPAGSSGFTISNCNVTGSVRGAYAKTVTDGSTVHGRSMVGGIGGSVKTSDMAITACRSFCKVFDCFNSDRGYNISAVNDEVFGSGAAFGRSIAKPMPSITGCTAWGEITATPLGPTSNSGGSFVGSFVGYAINFTIGDNTVNRAVNTMEPCGYSWDIQ